MTITYFLCSSTKYSLIFIAVEVFPEQGIPTMTIKGMLLFDFFNNLSSI